MSISSLKEQRREKKAELKKLEKRKKELEKILRSLEWEFHDEATAFNYNLTNSTTNLEYGI